MVDVKFMCRSSRYFQSDAAPKNLGRKTFKGGIATVGGQAMLFMLQLLSTMVLARTLTPDDFGLIGMVAVIVNFVALFKDFGLSRATMQRPEITTQQISNLFWFNLIIGLLLGGILVGVARYVALFYGRTELGGVTVALGVLVIFQGLGLQHRALMARQMEFLSLAVVAVISHFIGACLAVYMALNGYGYWSLVALTGAPPLVDAFFCMLFTGWLPGLPRRNAGTLPFLKYGSNMLGFNLVNFFSRNLDNILIGKYLGANSLGVYNMSYRMLLMPLQQINAPMGRPMLVALSKIQNDPERYRLAYRKSLKMVGTLTIPVVFFLGSCPTLLLTTLLGEQWHESASIFLALTPFAFVSATNVATGWVYSSLGHTDRQFRMGLVTSSVMVLSIMIGLQYGALGVAVAASTASVALRVPVISYCFRGTVLRLPDFFQSIARPTLSSFLALLSAHLVVFSLLETSELNRFWELGVRGCLFFMVYALCILSDRSSEGFSNTFLSLIKRKVGG